MFKYFTDKAINKIRNTTKQDIKDAGLYLAAGGVFGICFFGGLLLGLGIGGHMLFINTLGGLSMGYLGASVITDGAKSSKMMDFTLGLLAGAGIVWGGATMDHRPRLMPDSKTSLITGFDAKQTVQGFNDKSQKTTASDPDIPPCDQKDFCPIDWSKTNPTTKPK